MQLLHYVDAAAETLTVFSVISRHLVCSVQEENVVELRRTKPLHFLWNSKMKMDEVENMTAHSG